MIWFGNLLADVTPHQNINNKTITKVALHPLAMDVLTVPSQLFFARVTSTAYC